MPALSSLPSGISPVVPSLRKDFTTLLAVLALLLCWDLSGLDIVVSRWFGTSQGFVWRDHWFTSGVMHRHARQLGWVGLAVLAVNVRWPLPFARGLSRSQRLTWLAATAACASLMPAIKRVSSTSCPWSLAEFGGSVLHYVPHWMLRTADGGPGGCFPSGHAATALSFCVGWFALREQAPHAARWWLAVSLASGAALGTVQVMRGAHYLSHALWSAWLCWAVGTIACHAPTAWSRRSWLGRKRRIATTTTHRCPCGRQRQ